MATDRTDQPPIDDLEALDDDVEVFDEVEVLIDDDGTEYFVADGVRFEFADDGYAYAVADGPAEPAEPAEPAGDRSAAPTSWDDEVWSDDDAPPSPFSRQGEVLAATGAASAGVGPSPDAAQRQDRPAAPSDGDGGGALLRLEGVRSGYGSLPVLHGVDLSIAAGETAVLLGLNGAGKTTTAMSVCGALGTWDGTITFDGTDITSWSTKKAVDAGIVMVPEGRRVFPDLSVAKNLQMGAWSRRRDTDAMAEQLERVFGYFPRLKERTAQMAGTLSGGEQQMLAIGRGLMARPRLLIVDEASMGLAPVIVRDVFDIVSEIARDGVTVLMIEQNVAALDVADVAYVMEQGRMVTELRGDDVRDRDQVSEVLMG
jgi:branched-chain amino acid transport system ATP-binding protein